MFSGDLANASMTERWALIRRCLRAKGSIDLPFTQLEGELKAQAIAAPVPAHRATCKWVAKMVNKVERHVLPMLSPHDLQLLVMRNVRVLVHAVKKMRKGVAAGPDKISAPQIKRAPSRFLNLLAFFVAWASEQGVFPDDLRLARLKHIPKKEKGSFRGISVEDLITKLIEQCVAHPVFPAFGSPSPLIAEEQLHVGQ